MNANFEEYRGSAVSGKNTSPNFFLVGAPKCATSSLHLFLIEHTGVFMCRPKEPHFFSTDFPGLAEVGTREDYDALFKGAPNNAMLGEASAFYLASETAAKNIHAANPDARIILSIRNPVDASQSLYHQLRDGFREDQPDFQKAWALQGARASGRHLPPYCPEPRQLQYAEIYKYTDQIRRYFDTFGRERVKVVFFDEFRNNSEEVANGVLDFLGLSPFEKAVELPTSNVRREPLIPGMTQFVSSPPRVIRPLVAPVKRILNRMGIKPSDLIMNKLSRPAAKESKSRMDPAFRQELVQEFAPDIARLEDLLGRDLSAWRT